ncbi:uncharacterized protein LOC143248819 [Tachypleus tridentatus]|uniref:uncharacterized protein LOC143248819 n=1 Tax=Tachypleus tridentatus TaxID=6853 RepID=UPI003FCFC411
MKTLAAVILCYALVAVKAAPQGQYPPGSSQRPSLPPPPQVDWGQCAQLEPTQQEKAAKQQVIRQCVEQYPPTFKDPRNVTRQEAEEHRNSITTCALKAEGWFDANGKYNFEKAKNEIIGKSLNSDIQTEILKHHEACRGEAEQKFPNSYIQQVQLYQACMDVHISQTCRIRVIPPPNYRGPPPQGPPPQGY